MPTFDQFHDYSAGLTGPICGGFDIAPDDQADIEQVTRAIMVSAPGGCVNHIEERHVSDTDSVDCWRALPASDQPYKRDRHDRYRNQGSGLGALSKCHDLVALQDPDRRITSGRVLAKIARSVEKDILAR